MRRLLATIAIVVACVGLVFAGTAADDPGTYKVRAVFDNGGFIVPGEDVRVAGANVGSVESVDVTGKEETASLEGGAHPVPGKAVVVLEITDPGFKDFRRDASCLIRPQSLIGEKYVDCQVTQARAPGSQAPPPLPVLGEGEPGEGQHLLPLENNGKAVDLDLINNIQRLPYAQRFRLILNDLGAGLAARGPDLAEIVRRANPALRQFDRVLAILASQNQALAKLQSDSDAILQPLARERAAVAGFIDSSGETAEASAERRADIERGLAKLPRTLEELRLTMRELGGFSREATPVFRDFGRAAPSLTVASKQLAPFATATNISLRSLGAAAEEAGPLLVEADPTIRNLTSLAQTGARPFTNFGRLLVSLRKTKGFERLMDFIYANVGSVNGFDQFGHYLRTNFLATNCIEYATVKAPECDANWDPEAGSSSVARTPTGAEVARMLAAARREERRREAERRAERERGTPGSPRGASRDDLEDSGASGGARDILNYLLGE